jgi:pyruvate/2-oxoglutarate dehydrogenase complex dihydrolipoamide acyltransferase (E2) component
MAEFEIVVPSEIPVDETVLVVAINFENGTEISKGAAVFEIETSKTAYTLEADMSGTLFHQLSLDDEVKSGQIVGVVHYD